jgi:hypothetical protein
VWTPSPPSRISREPPLVTRSCSAARLLKGDTEVGHQGGVCTVTSVARSEAQCLATYSLRGGQITGQALVNLGNPAPYAVAITGGSGKDQGAEGEVRVQPVSATRGILTFHLKD